MKQPAHGILIAIEGIDGSGKSTLAQNLAHRLQQDQLDIMLTKEPGATPLGSVLRQLVQKKEVAIAPKAEYLLFAADRAQHMQEIVLPALADRKIVISDRMADSSLAYQGYGRGLDRELINRVNRWALEDRLPDLVIYVRITPALAAQRIAARNATRTSFEKDMNFLERVAQGFDTLFQARDNVLVVDGSNTISEVTQQAYTQLVSWITNKN